MCENAGDICGFSVVTCPYIPPGDKLIVSPEDLPFIIHDAVGEEFDDDSTIPGRSSN